MADRDYAEEKLAAYNACVEIVAERPRSKKKDRILIAEIREKSGLEVSEASNAMKWLKRKSLAEVSEDGSIGWWIKKMRVAPDRFCWSHGIMKEVKGRGKTKQVFCPICVRNE